MTGCMHEERQLATLVLPLDDVVRAFGSTILLFFFFLRAKFSKTKVKSTHRCAHQKHSRMPCLTDHLVHRRDHAVATTCKVKEGQNRRLRGCATQQRLPSPEPRSSTVALQVLGEFTQRKSAVSSDQRPPTSATNTTKRALPPFSNKLRVRALFVCGPAPRLLHFWWLHLAWHFRLCAKVTPLWCWPTGIFRNEGARPPPLPAVCHPRGRAVPNPCRAQGRLCGPWLHLLCTLCC